MSLQDQLVQLRNTNPLAIISMSLRADGLGNRMTHAMFAARLARSVIAAEEEAKCGSYDPATGEYVAPTPEAIAAFVEQAKNQSRVAVVSDGIANTYHLTINDFATLLSGVNAVRAVCRHGIAPDTTVTVEEARIAVEEVDAAAKASLAAALSAPAYDFDEVAPH